MIKSKCVNSSQGIQLADPYSDTLLVATVNFPDITGFSVTKVLSACGHSIGPIPVAQGDRIALRIDASLSSPQTGIDSIAFNGGVEFTPS